MSTNEINIKIQIAVSWPEAPIFLDFFDFSGIFGLKNGKDRGGLNSPLRMRGRGVGSGNPPPLDVFQLSYRTQLGSCGKMRGLAICLHKKGLLQRMSRKMVCCHSQVEDGTGLVIL